MAGKNLDDMLIYKQAVELSELAFKIYKELPPNFQNHPGNQFITSVDSIGANIAEGYGRYHYKDSIRFYLIARGSLFEARHWVFILWNRNLISDEMYQKLNSTLYKEGVWINNFIKSIKNRNNISDENP